MGGGGFERKSKPEHTPFSTKKGRGDDFSKENFYLKMFILLCAWFLSPPPRPEGGGLGR